MCKVLWALKVSPQVSLCKADVEWNWYTVVLKLQFWAVTWVRDNFSVHEHNTHLFLSRYYFHLLWRTSQNSRKTQVGRDLRKSPVPSCQARLGCEVTPGYLGLCPLGDQKPLRTEIWHDLFGQSVPCLTVLMRKKFSAKLWEILLLV